MRPPKPKRGERRMDAAVQHLAEYGFAEPQIRNVINDLLKVYGRDGWVLLEKESYRMVLDKLLEEQSPEAPRTLHSIGELGALKVFTPSAISRGTAAVEAMRRPKPKRGERRIDAAIQRLTQYGFTKRQIRNVINDLLQVYGGDGWALLEEGSYSIVLDKLLELDGQVRQDQSPEAPQALHSIGELGPLKVFTPSAISRGTASADTMRPLKRKRGDLRIVAAIEHLTQYGFAKAQIRKAINDLLQLYGRDGWFLLEEGSYDVVLNKLLEQVQQDQDEDGSTIPDE